MTGVAASVESRPDPDGLTRLVEERFALSASLTPRFFEDEAERIASACWAMARRFHRGGRLLAYGDGPCATDAQHIAVEFVHPVIVGKRALPALALSNDSAVLGGLAASYGHASVFARQLELIGQTADTVIGIAPGGGSASVRDGLRQARSMDLLTIALTGGDRGRLAGEPVDFCFAVPSDDPFIVQETHETLYHVLWELVHVFFEHEGLLEGSEA